MYIRLEKNSRRLKHRTELQSSSTSKSYQL